MTDYRFMYDLLRAQVEGAIKGLEEMETQFGDLTMHGRGMKDAFEDVLKNMKELEER